MTGTPRNRAFFFYLGLARTTGVKSSIMNATGTFFSVLLAHFIYHNDRLSFNKVLGCLVGFIGVIVVNFGRGAMQFDFTLLGEGSVVMAALVLLGYLVALSSAAFSREEAPAAQAALKPR